MTAPCWDRFHPDGRPNRGKAVRSHMRHAAYLALEAMMGPWFMVEGELSNTCPLTGKVFPLRLAEVDKADPTLGYVPSNIMMVSRIGNQRRGDEQQWHGDIPGAARYINDVAKAWENVTLPRQCDSLRWYVALGLTHSKNTESGRRNDVLDGPYGVE